MDNIKRGLTTGQKRNFTMEKQYTPEIRKEIFAEHEFSTFKVDGSLFGINLLNIQEINRHVEITSVPQSFDYVEGILNLRGRIVSVINLGKKLELAPVKKIKTAGLSSLTLKESISVRVREMN